MESSATKAKLGQRWVCFKCNARFYDLNKPEPICPKCSANQQESPAFQKPGKKRPAKKAAAVATPKKEAAPPPSEDIEMRRDDEMEEEFSEEGEFDLEDLELEDGGGGDDDSVGLVEVEED